MTDSQGPEPEMRRVAKTFEFWYNNPILRFIAIQVYLIIRDLESLVSRSDESDHESEKRTEPVTTVIWLGPEQADELVKSGSVDVEFDGSIVASEPVFRIAVTLDP